VVELEKSDTCDMPLFSKRLSWLDQKPEVIMGCEASSSSWVLWLVDRRVVLNRLDSVRRLLHSEAGTNLLSFLK